MFGSLCLGRRLLLGGSLLVGPLLLADARAQAPFPDIPPCHWAADAVTDIAGKREVDLEQARSSSYLAENAVRQVFEGLRCESPEWSRAFLKGEPEGWPRQVPAVDFQLSVADVRLAGEVATASVQIVLTVGSETTERSGELELAFEDGLWMVDYSSLVQLDLPLFR